MSDQSPAPPTTTAEEDLQTAAVRAGKVTTAEGQRRINLIWEVTQSLIALAVTAAVIYAALRGINSEILGNAFTLIIAIYFVRMNHTKIGGVSPAESRSA